MTSAAYVHTLHYSLSEGVCRWADATFGPVRAAKNTVEFDAPTSWVSSAVITASEMTINLSERGLRRRPRKGDTRQTWLPVDRWLVAY